MLYLTVEQHQEVLQRLLNLSKEKSESIPYHSAGPEYTSLMICFFLHNQSVAESLLRLKTSFTNSWFPVSVGYTITRTMFETDVIAHYISKDPADLARRYIEFGHVINKKQMDAYSKHRKSKNPSWREGMEMVWNNHWESQEQQIIDNYKAVVDKFTLTSKKGRKAVCRSWAGKTIRQMAVEVDHEEAYDIFYSELSSFAHVNIKHADRFLKKDSDGLLWSQRAEEFDVGNVFRNAATFYTCFLELIGKEFNLWSGQKIKNCWTFNEVDK